MANYRRSESQKKRVQKRRDILARKTDEVDGNPSPLSTLDLFLEGDASNQSALREEQQKRSERAALAYQTRLQNASKRRNAKVKAKGKKAMPRRENLGDSNVSEAKERIQCALNERTKPNSADIQIMLEPQRLSGRTDLMKDVLLKSFGMRGKCIPDLKVSDTSEYYRRASPTDIDAMSKKFVTKCSVHEIGSFLDYKLRQVERGDI